MVQDGAMPPQNDDDAGRHPGERETAPLPAGGALPALPAMVGAYRIVRVLGSGGMGVVYEAVQASPRRTVALKVMRPDAGGASGVARFRQEGELLARLRHPGIAQVYEAGMHPDPTGDPELASPFLAMELVAGGVPIDRWVAMHRPGVRGVLTLIARVCEAMEHAHAAGVIHRDLKPANILVEPGGAGAAEVGRPRVIDFGVARAVGAVAAITTPGEIVGTFEYMSPEQCGEGPGDSEGAPWAASATESSDVYALGVVLYELLTGRLPYAVRGRSAEGATRVIREVEPPSPGALDPALKGDVSTVVLRALAKDPVRRYPTALALREDLERCLAGEPVLARRDHASYLLGRRLGGWSRRHPALAAAAAWGAGTAAALWIGMPLVFEWTGMNRAFSAWAETLVPPPAAAGRLDRVRVVGLNDETPISALALELGFADVDEDAVRSFRRLHGRMLERLARSGAQAVVVDILFEAASEYDAELIAGVDALAAARPPIPVVVAMSDWVTGPDGTPLVHPGLKGKVRSGAVSGGFLTEATYAKTLFVVRRGVDPLYSLALAAFGATRAPGAVPALRVLNSETGSIELRYGGLRAADTLPITSVERRDSDEPSHGLLRGDECGQFIFPLPTQATRDGAAVRYESVLRADDAQLRRWFEGMTVVLANARAGADRVASPAGTAWDGFWIEAAAVDALLSSTGLAFPHAAWTIAACAGFAGAGAASGAQLSRRPRLLLAALCGLTVVAVGGSLAALAIGRISWNPLVPVVGAIVAAIVSAWLVRLRPPALAAASTRVRTP